MNPLHKIKFMKLFMDMAANPTLFKEQITGQLKPVKDPETGELHYYSLNLHLTGQLAKDLSEMIPDGVSL